jgi:hypothetical protein
MMTMPKTMPRTMPKTMPRTMPLTMPKTMIVIKAARAGRAIAGLVAALWFLTGAPDSAGADASLTSVGGQSALKEARFEMNVTFDGVVAQVSARQSIVNAGAAAAEALYTFDLPVDAAVTGATIRTADGRSSTAVVVEAGAALTPMADPDGIAAAPDLGVLRLVARDVPGIDGDTSLSTATYELRVYPVPPQQAVTVTVDWVAPLRYDDGRLLLRIPGRGSAAGLVREQVSLRLTPPPGVRGFGAVHGGGRALGRGIRQASFPAGPRGDVVIDAALDFGAETRPVVGVAKVPMDGAMGAIGLSVLAPLPAAARDLGYERLLLVLDVSRSLGRPGLDATATMVDALLGSLPANARVEVLLFDSGARRLFGRFRANDAEARKALAQALRPDELANGSDLGAALDSARALLAREALDAKPEEGFERGARATTLMVVVSDGMIPLELTPRRALDRLGPDVLGDVSVASVILVPDEAPVPDTREGALATLARKSSGRVMAVRFGEAAARAKALAATLSRPVLLTDVDVDTGGAVLDGIELSALIEPGQGVIAMGLYRGAAPASVAITGLSQGQPVRLQAQRDAALGRVALPLAMVRAQKEDFVAAPVEPAREPGATPGATAAAAAAAGQRRLVAMARRAGAVTRDSSLVLLDAGDRFARDRLTMTRTWGASTFFRLPPPPERSEEHVFRRFERRVPPDRHAADTPPRRTGQLDRQIVERLLERHVKPMATACYEDALRRAPALAGTMTVVLELARGEVQHAEVQRSTLQNAGVEACVARAAYSIQVPRVALGDDPEIISVVRYPLELRKRQRSGEVRARSADEEPALRELLDSNDPLDGLDQRQ